MMDGTGLSVADALALGSNRNDDGFGFGGGSGFLLFFFLFFILAFAGNGWGNGTGTSGAANNYVLASDFATLQRQIDSGVSSLERKGDAINNGLCDGFYAMNTGLLNGFASVNNSISNLGYNNAQMFNGIDKTVMQGNNAITAQLADCCCKTQQNIKDAITQGIMNTNVIQGSVKDYAFANEKAVMQSRFDAQQYNCQTLQAIDKLGDRIIDYMANEKAQTLRDENFTLKLKESQALQNNYLVSELRPVARPAYITCSPYESAYGRNNCGCGYQQSCGC